MLKMYWETESIGITDDIESANHLPFKAKRNEEISFDGRHYEAALPWKGDYLPFTNNYRTIYHFFMLSYSGVPGETWF